MYVCRICGEPLREMDDQTLILMQHFDMPKDGGIHAECLFKEKEAAPATTGSEDAYTDLLAAQTPLTDNKKR